jgi:hypothetical protein
LGELRRIAENAFETMEDREMAVRRLGKYACRDIPRACYELREIARSIWNPDRIRQLARGLFGRCCT